MRAAVGSCNNGRHRANGTTNISQLPAYADWSFRSTAPSALGFALRPVQFGHCSGQSLYAIAAIATPVFYTNQLRGSAIGEAMPQSAHQVELNRLEELVRAQIARIRTGVKRTLDRPNHAFCFVFYF